VTVERTVFWDVMRCILVEFHRRFGKHAASVFRVDEWAKYSGSKVAGFLLYTYLAHFASMTMEKICFSETVPKFYKTALS
jgi:hypothetical protein